MDITAKRIRETEQMIADDPQLQQLIASRHDYVQTIKTYDLNQLMNKIQPMYNKLNRLSEEEAEKLVLLMLEYRLRGLDMEYFTQGAGGRGNCSIL